MPEARRGQIEGLADVGVRNRETRHAQDLQGVSFVDTHVHLAWKDFAADIDAVIARAEAAGVERMLTVGVDEESSTASVALTTTHSRLFAAVGLHPTSCAEVDTRFDVVAHLARTNHRRVGGPVVAIGETGLDFYRDRVPAAEQRNSFNRHLELAAELDLPVIIHNRHADDAVLQALGCAPAGVRGVMHCFSGTMDLADHCVERGFYVSFAGNLTYRTAAALREVAARVPADRLLIETDAPFLPPQPWRGRRNEPAYAVETLRVLAEVRQSEPMALGRQIVSNAQALFGW